MLPLFDTHNRSSKRDSSSRMLHPISLERPAVHDTALYNLIRSRQIRNQVFSHMSRPGEKRTDWNGRKRQLSLIQIKLYLPKNYT